MARLLTESGITPAQIALEPAATDTLSSVIAVSTMLRALPDAPVYACSSAYHLPRCRLLLWLAGHGHRGCPPPAAPAARSPWRRWYWRLRELPALPYDAALMLWRRTGPAPR
jgi:uncharacterized SAM-binding protein YcdF (DUF218 family)